MTDTNPSPERKSKRCGSPAMRFGFLAVMLVAVGVIGATFIGSSHAGSGWKGHGGHHKVTSVEDARQRGERMAAWLAGAVDADDTQAAQIEAILGNLGADLFPIRAQHREHRLQLITEISRPQIDAQKLERLRQETVQLADAATLELTESLLALSEVLQAEQRQQLVALAARFGHGRHH